MKRYCLAAGLALAAITILGFASPQEARPGERDGNVFSAFARDARGVKVLWGDSTVIDGARIVTWALVSPRDWCTADLRWVPPRHVSQLAEATRLRADELLSFAPLVLGRTAPAWEPDLYRVVGAPPPEKGKRRLFVCNDDGRGPVARLDKHATADNEGFDLLERGQLVRLRGLERRGDGLRLGPESGVDPK